MNAHTPPPHTAAAPAAGGHLPLLVSMGDPCGIGPEIIAQAWERRGPAAGAPLAIVGDVLVMQRALALVGSGAVVARIATPADVSRAPAGALPVLQPADWTADVAQAPLGRVDARAGAASARCVEEAVAWVQSGHAAGLVTAPIHKEAWALAGVNFPGHTEMLQALAARGGPPPPVRMMLASPELRVVLVTVHMALRDAIAAIDTQRVLETLRITHAAAAHRGLARPRIAVAGLNPHAGEGGLFGDEERLYIAPAIAAARSEGIDASGPHAPDTVFMRARAAADHAGEFDVVVAMTHDHGLIPVKYLGVAHGVNVTLGLPFVRTSPDHGTAFDLAGSGRADPSSLLAALEMAARMVADRT